MSTSCRIGVKVNDKIESIYCHFDGYPKGKFSVGQMLKDHYTDEEKLAKLMELGDISSLGTEPVENLRGWDPAPDRDDSKCVAYRTRGETDVDKAVSSSEEDYIYLMKLSNVYYAYLFKDDGWYVIAAGGRSESFKKY